MRTSRWIAVPIGLLPVGVIAIALSARVPANTSPGVAAMNGQAVHFEPNRGQAVPDTEFLAYARGLTVAISGSGMELALADAAPVTLRWLGADAGARGNLRRPLHAVTNYLVGDRSRWVRHVPRYRELRYRRLYPGVDLRYYDAGGELEYDLELAAGVDPSAIRLRVEGADEVGVGEAGELRVRVGERALTKTLPAVYQTGADGTRHPLRGSFVQHGPEEVGFSLPGADPALPTVIDPKILTSTYVGGPRYDSAYGVAVDSARNAYVVGFIEAPGLPGLRPPGRASGFIARYDRVGKVRVFTYVGGSSEDYLSQVAVFEPRSGNRAGAFVAVAGGTLSADLPTVRPIQDTIDRKNGDILVARLNLALDEIDFLTPLGGSDQDFMNALAVGSDGRILVGGGTWSRDFPLVNPTQKKHAGGGTDSWVAIIDVDAAGGPQLTFSSLLGGEEIEGTGGVAWTQFEASTRSARACMLISGRTSSREFPTVNALQSELDQGVLDEFGQSNADVFLTMWCERAGKPPELLYSSYYGGKQGDSDSALMVDSAGRVVLVLETSSPDLELKNPLFDQFIEDEEGLGADLAIAVFDLGGLVRADGRAGEAELFFASYLPRAEYQLRPHAALGKNDTVYAVAELERLDPPQVGLLPVLVDYGASASHPPAVRWLEEIGGSGYDSAFAVAVDRKQRLHVVGFTDSDDWPLVKPAQQAFGGGYADGFYVLVKR